MDIGVIGLGNMGAAIAKRLLEAGHDVTVYNRSPEKAKKLLGFGATLEHDPSGAAQGDMVFTVLADDHAVEQVLFGDPDAEDDSDADAEDLGLIPHQGKRTIHVSVSTISAQLSRRINAASEALGKRYISATVVGRPDVAERGELIVMASGQESLIDKCMPAFQAFSKSIHVMGNRPEQANISKLAANFMISSMIETFAEAFALVRKNDIDHQKFMQIMAGEFFKSPVYEKYGKIIAGDKFDTGAFTVRLQEKDTRLALAAAIESQVPMPIACAIENAFLSAIGRGKGDLDPCVIAEIAAENAGLRTKVRK